MLMLAMTMLVVAVAVIVGLQEVRVEVELGVQVEAAQVEHLVQRDLAEMHGLDRRARVHVPDPVLELGQLRLRHQVGLADEDLVGKAELAPRLLAVVELLLRMLGIDQREDRVEQIALGDLLVHEEGLRHRARIGQTGGLDHDALEVEQALALLGRQQLQRAAQVFADGAADAAVAHLDDLLLGVGDQDVGVDVFLAELVLDHGDLLAMRLGQHALEQGGLAGSEESGQDGDGYQCHGVLAVSRSRQHRPPAVELQSISVVQLSRVGSDRPGPQVVPPLRQTQSGRRISTRPLRYSPSGKASAVG